ncbi:MAG: tetratricopeptide repeat protein [Chloroflexi bacterium]|nr:MAG: tetratricopeptide repeat protein [Chloroflexota bacterium]
MHKYVILVHIFIFLTGGIELMSENQDIQRLLLRARLFLEEGQRDKALMVLETIDTESQEQRQEVDYLLAWGYTLAKRWEDALRVLSPLPDLAEDEGEQENRIDRGRLAQCFLRLGDTAVNLARYEDAAHHYTRCLKILQDKRIHLPLVQVKARYGLAMTHVMRELYAAAIQHYELALGLCLHIDDDEIIGNIYYGLSDVYRRSGNLIKAQLAGEKALELYEVEGRLEEARRYCQRAQEMSGRFQDKDGQLTGLTYLVTGKVTHAEAQRAEGGQRQKLLEETIKWFEKAKDKLAPTQSYADVAELFGRWAQVLEELGQFEEAILCWKSGYEALSSSYGQTWY